MYLCKILPFSSFRLLQRKRSAQPPPSVLCYLAFLLAFVHLSPTHLPLVFHGTFLLWRLAFPAPIPTPPHPTTFISSRLLQQRELYNKANNMLYTALLSGCLVPQRLKLVYRIDRMLLEASVLFLREFRNISYLKASFAHRLTEGFSCRGDVR